MISFFNKYQKQIYISILILCSLFLFLSINSLPLSSDDLIYSKKWASEETLSSISDIIYYQKMHYMLWGGRTVAHTILQLLFLLGKPLSSALTTMVFIAISYLISKYSNQNFKASLGNMLFIFGLLFFLNQTFFETILWMTGAANYLWTTLIILLALYPYIKYIKGFELNKLDYTFIPLSFLAGWCNENTSAVMIFFMFCFALYTYRQNKKVYIWNITSFVLSSIGFCLLVLAPGNAARSSYLAQGIMSILYRGHGQVNAWFNWLFLTIIILVVVNYISKNNKDLTKISFVIMAVLSMLIMIASPTYPSRACFGSMILFLIAIMSDINIIKTKHIHLYNTLVLLFGIAFAMNMFSIALLQIVRNSGVYIP